jgi:hypothetical protein
MLDETCNATAALSALLYAFNTSSQNATKCYQQEGHSPVFEHAFRKTLDLFFPPESLLASLVKNAWFPARMAGIYGKTTGCCREEFTAHQQKNNTKVRTCPGQQTYRLGYAVPRNTGSLAKEKTRKSKFDRFLNSDNQDNCGATFSGK